MTPSEDDFFQLQAQQLEKAISHLCVTDPEIFQPPVPGSVEAEELEKLHQRLADLSSLSAADMEAYYKEYSQPVDIDWLSPLEKNNQNFLFNKKEIGERLSYHGTYFAVEKIGELAKLPELHPHAFRHTYCTELLLQGVDPTHARRLTGHKNEQAFKRYTLRSEQEAAIPLCGLRFAIAAYYRAIGEEPGGDL